MTTAAEALREVLADDDLIWEVGRKAVEDQLIDMRNSNMFVLNNNGLVIKNFDGTVSSTIRMSTEMAIKCALGAMAEELEKRDV
jgi:hypothetical protein